MVDIHFILPDIRHPSMLPIYHLSTCLPQFPILHAYDRNLALCGVYYYRHYRYSSQYLLRREKSFLEGLLDICVLFNG